ncbi:MAG: Acetylpolyamine amidohydrolase [Paracidovorax wautersii]|uniref:Acetylpolyamine amidohydrolase n=1 Tax=Paracidovorax wautersii TaxID=1177982 RepID=A0A7V8JPW6_9BURK|nr:MAG: Acetylpolyamine amidohydrolase [Paracidovorax wautersii]
MQAFFAADQLLHDPQQFMRLGRIHKPTDLPARAEALRDALADVGVTLQEPHDWGRAPLEAVHAPHYLDYLETAYPRWQALGQTGLEPGIEVLPNLSPYPAYTSGPPGDVRPPCPSSHIVAQTGYYIGNLACPLGPHSWQAMRRSAHAAVSAAQALCEGERLAYALCRPSGHHAYRDRAGGFCYLNNSAIAAQHLASHLRAGQPSRVAVLDIDVHHGDGTQHIFYTRSDVLTLSIHAATDHYYPFYVGYAQETGHGAGEGFNLNLPLPHGSGNAVFLDAFKTALARLADFQPDAVVLPMGFDTYKDDPIGVFELDFDAY